MLGRVFQKPRMSFLERRVAPMHAKELLQRLLEGGLQIKGKTPLTSVATSLKRDKRFQKVGPNTFAVMTQELTAVV